MDPAHPATTSTCSPSIVPTLRTVSKVTATAAIALRNIAIPAATMVLASPVLAGGAGFLLVGLLCPVATPSAVIGELFYFFVIQAPGIVASSVYTASFMIPFGIAAAATFGTVALLGGTGLLLHFAANKIAKDNGEETLSLDQLYTACTNSLFCR